MAKTTYVTLILASLPLATLSVRSTSEFSLLATFQQWPNDHFIYQLLFIILYYMAVNVGP